MAQSLGDEIMYYDEEQHAELTIETEKVQSAARVIRKYTEVESDSDHVSSGLHDFEMLNEAIYDGPVWPDTEDVDAQDIENAREVAEMFGLERLEYKLETSFEDDGGHIIETF